MSMTGWPQRSVRTDGVIVSIHTIADFGHPRPTRRSASASRHGIPWVGVSHKKAGLDGNVRFAETNATQS
jgi:hypothetical protein